MKRFVTALTVIIATAAIVLAIMPTSFAMYRGTKAEIYNAAINANEEEAFNQLIRNNHDEIVELCIKYDHVSGCSYRAIINDLITCIDDIATYGSKTYDLLPYEAVCDKIGKSDWLWNEFETLFREYMDKWHYNPVPSLYYDVGPTDTNAVLNAAKGTRYENLIAEWVNKVETEKAAYNNEPAPITPVVDAGEFTDVAATHWANANIKKVAKIGAFNGYEDGTFRPDNEITHGEFIKAVMAIIYDYRDVTEASKAPITWADWAQPYLNAAFEMDIVERGDNDLISQGTPITRAEMAKVTARVLEVCDKAIETADDVGAAFADWDTIPNHYKPYIAKAYTVGALSGYEDGTFRPDKTLTRAEAAAIIIRIADFKTEKSPNN